MWAALYHDDDAEVLQKYYPSVYRWPDYISRIYSIYSVSSSTIDTFFEIAKFYENTLLLLLFCQL